MVPNLLSFRRSRPAGPRPRVAAIAFGTALGWAGPAAAQGVTLPDPVDPLTLILGAAGGAVIAALIAMRAGARQRARIAEMERGTERLQRVAAQFTGLLFSGPAPVYYWSRVTGTEAASPELAVLLGLDQAPNFDALLGAAVEEDGLALKEKVRDLRKFNTPFTARLRLRDGRRLAVVGAPARGGAPNGPALAHGVWFDDETETTRQQAHLAEDTAVLRREAARLRLLIDTLPVPIWRRDGELALTDCNHAYVAAVEARSVAAAVVEQRELGAGVIARDGRAMAAQALEEGQPVTRHYHIVIGGDRRLLRLTEIPLGGERDQGLIGFAIDGTEVEELRNDLAQHIRAHAEVLENLSTAIAIFGADTRLKFFNAAYQQLWDLDEDWLWGEPGLGEILEKLRENRRLPEAVDFQAYKDSELRKFNDLLDAQEDLLHLPDGTTLRRMVSPHPFGGLMVSLEDVTDTLAMERNYNTLIAVQRETLDNLHEAVAVIGADGRLRLCNASFAQIWDLPRDLLADTPHIADLIEAARGFWGRTEQQWPEFKARMVGRITNHQPMTGRLERADGSILDFAVVPLPDGAVMLSYVNVTDSIRVERALRDRNEALRTADHIKSDFIATVSGELVRPLDAIIAEADRLLVHAGPDGENGAEVIRGEAKALQSLVDDMRDLATLGSGQVTLELDTVDPRRLLKSVEVLTRSRLLEENVVLRLFCGRNIGWMVADERRLKQALFILVSNAIRHAPSGSEVTITARRRGEEVAIVLGVSEDAHQLRLFKEIDAQEPGAARQALGLAMVRAVVEIHGGRLELHREGLEVTCYLPAGDTDHTAPVFSAMSS